MSEEVPEKNDEAVFVIVGKNYEETVYDENKAGKFISKIPRLRTKESGFCSKLKHLMKFLKKCSLGTSSNFFDILRNFPVRLRQAFRLRTFSQICRYCNNIL